MIRRELIDYCLTLPDAYEDYPFDDIINERAWTVMRHREGRKGFAHIYERGDRLCINLKCDPLEADFLRKVYVSVTPGYHMNKTHWNTVILDGDVPEDELKRMIQQSYTLTAPKRKRKT
jgi:predicted DNA-binding protein (MmcQ/YjbR family)